MKKHLNKIKKNYLKHFHNKWYSLIVYSVFFLLIIALLIFLNIYFIEKGKYSLKQLSGTLSHWNSSTWWGEHGLSGGDFQAIKRGWYNVFATIIAAGGMTVAAVATQSLTRNPIAEGSTLGLVQGAIFGVIFAISFGMSSFLQRYIYAAIFGVVAAVTLLLFILVSKKRRDGLQRIILAGLAIGVIFKTLTFMFKAGDANLNTVSFAYVLGGAETISNSPLAMAFDNMSKSLMISAILVGISLLLLVINMKGMNLLEIGDERAKNLGSNVFVTRIINVIVVFLAIPAAVMIVGNMAFLGLFSIHAARWISRSRNYKKVLPISLMMGMIFANLGMQLTEHIPSINSGIWMTFVGAPYLIFIGIRGLK